VIIILIYFITYIIFKLLFDSNYSISHMIMMT
jgi:hypothetical protein